MFTAMANEWMVDGYCSGYKLAYSLPLFYVLSLCVVLMIQYK